MSDPHPPPLPASRVNPGFWPSLTGRAADAHEGHPYPNQTCWPGSGDAEAPPVLHPRVAGELLLAVLAPGARNRPHVGLTPSWRPSRIPRLPAQPYRCPPGRNRTANPAGKRRTGRCGADYAGGHDWCWRGRSAPNDPNTVDRPHDPRQRGARRECLSSVAGRDPKDAAAAICPSRRRQHVMGAGVTRTLSFHRGGDGCLYSLAITPRQHVSIALRISVPATRPGGGGGAAVNP